MSPLEWIENLFLAVFIIWGRLWPCKNSKLYGASVLRPHQCRVTVPLSHLLNAPNLEKDLLYESHKHRLLTPSLPKSR